jgi:hypothetical protein
VTYRRGSGLMTVFIIQLYNLLLHFTHHCMTLDVFSSQSSSTVILRDSINSITGALGSASGRIQQKTPFPNNSSIVIEVCLPRRCIETVDLLLLRAYSFPLTESLSNNERLLWFRYSGFQASCHNILLNQSCYVAY